MYESFYGFDQRPFLTVPTLDRYFPAASVEAAYQTVLRAIQRCEGPVAIFGGAGLGKTMCCLRIAASIPRSFDVITLASAQVITRRALLQSLLYEMHLPCRDGSEGELRLRLLERLQASDENSSEGLVLIVDEAQTLSMKLLDELRSLTNVVHAGVPRLRLVLCGTLRLEETLTHPQMESLNQRLAARCYLTPLNHLESDRYVQHKIELCGQSLEDVITADGLEAIYRASDGIPRLIDQVADQALLLGAKESIRPINAAVVGYAWSSLQQLPNPWSDALPSSATLSGQEASDLEEFEDAEEPAVEFGALDEYGASEPSSMEGSTSQEPDPQPLFEELNLAANDSLPENLFCNFFESDDSETFPIPVQSLRDYQTLSGIAPGESLPYDTLAWESIQPSATSQSYREAMDFIEPVPAPAPQPNHFPFEGYAKQETQATIRPGSSEDDLDAIVSNIDDEMRGLVSNLNAQALHEHFQSNPALQADYNDDEELRLADLSPSSTDMLRMQPLDESSVQPPSAGGISDDRDMIIIEEDMLEIKRMQAQAMESKPSAPIHPYAQLFSQTRNS